MTFEELKAAKFVAVRSCGICGSPVGYMVHPTMAVACFNSGCGCSGDDNYRVLTHAELDNLTPAPLTEGQPT
jgi:hypothetical protein